MNALRALSSRTMASAALPPRVPIPRHGVDYRGVVALAPMVRSGELPTRLLALHYGADLVWGPETIDRALIGTTRRLNPHTGTVDFTRRPSNGGRPHPEDAPESIIYRLHPEKEKGKLIFQLGTAHPDTAVEAARLVAGDVAGIDVNAGCPKPFSTTGGMGAALLRDPERLASILRALVGSVGAERAIGISVKIRLLPEPADTRALVRRLARTGITGLTVHCRTPAMRPRERAVRAQLRDVVGICREAGIACLMNGDVAGRDEAVRLAEEYGADGALIATAAEANPSVFRPEVDGGPVPWREVVEGYVRCALAVDNKWANTKFMLHQLVPGKSPEGRECHGLKNYEHLVDVMGMKEELAEKAKEVDERCGLVERVTPAMEKAARKRDRAAAHEGGSGGAKKRRATQQRTPGMLRQAGDTAQHAMAV